MIIDGVIYIGLTLLFDHLINNSVISGLFHGLMERQRPRSDDYDLAERSLPSTNVEPISDGLRTKKVIEIQNVVKMFGPTVAVNGITLDLYESQITSFLGANSAGKTTLIGLLTGQLKPTSGNAVIYGYNVQCPSDLQKLRTNFGVCLQEDIILEELTCLEHLQFVAKMKGLQDSEVKVEVEKMLRLMDLTEQKDTRADKLSGGEKRKLSIAMAVIADSKIIFLDECTSGVDAYSRRKIWTALQSIKKDRVIILTTHFMDEADLLSDRKVL